MWTLALILTTLYYPIRGDIDMCVAEYLQQYGYLDVSENEIRNISEESFEKSLKLFQEYYNLTANGLVNEETLNLTKAPRCGVEDDISFTVSHHKWGKNDITWHYPLATAAHVKLAEAAFDAWGEVTNLIFRHDTVRPDITIVNAMDKHRYYAKRGICPFPLDGHGKILAHAELPTVESHPLEIHIDQAENWYLKKDHSIEFANLYKVLLHEIGHSLGISHSRDKRHCR
ncbi:matrix metalloproteinase-19-like [Hetaerina americana]|uniref:matrix metalloproteinase-19-like n=1 Tax=Hetaerina americana TaxID=62018 RepID=UPI003A7F556C